MKKLLTLLIAFHLLVLPVKAHASGMGQLVGIGVAAVGVTLALNCKIPTPSMMLYMAGAAAFLMGEMNAAKSHKSGTEESNKEAEDLQKSGVRGGELQKKALEAQLKQKERDLSLAKKRQMWSTAAAVAFIAAAAISALELPIFWPIPICLAPGPGTAGAMAAGAGIVGAYAFIGGGNLMSLLLGAVAGVVAAQSFAVNAFNNNFTRSAAMGVAAGLVTLSALGAGKAAGKLEGEIKELKTLIAQFKSETDGKGPNSEDTSAGANSGSESGLSGGSSSGSGNGSVTPIAALPKGIETKGTSTCLTATQEFSTNCSNPMKFSTPNFNGLGNGPDLQQVANQTTQFANAATSGDIGKADVAAASLASMAGSMNDLLKKNRAAANKKLIAEGKKSVDFEKQEKDILNSMQSAFQKSTADKQGQLAALGLDSISLDPAKADGSGQDIKSVSATAAIAVPTATGEAASAVDPALNANAAAASSAELQKAGESAKDALGNNLNEYESTEEDISKNKEDTLWKQVSNRYLLNYQRFFERSKGPAPSQ